MSDIWYISATLEHIDEMGKIIWYKMDLAQEYALPNLGTILLWLRDACESLLKELEKKKANTEDIEYVKKEIALLKEFEGKYKKR